MSKGRHRRPRPVRSSPIRLWIRVLTGCFSRRRAPSRTVSMIIPYPELTVADVIAAATTSCEVVEPCPWGLSAGACVVFHPPNHVSRFAEVEPA